MIDEQQAVELALAHARRDARGYTFEASSADKNRRDWTVAVNIIGQDGRYLLSPIVFVVDEESGAVRDLVTAISAGWRP